MSVRLNRRRFLQTSSAAGLGYLFTGPAVSVARAYQANGRLKVAGIGVGGKGSGDISQAGELMEVVGLCDIDESKKHLGWAAEKWPQAKTYFDYRKMLDEIGKDIDAVTVSTPDHNHALASILAMRQGKHVYCQKPLTHSVFEARLMREVARKHKVCTQMGNQGTAANGLRRAVEFLQDGGIGAIQQAHVWTNRPIWPQAPKVTKRLPAQDVPKTIHWNEFLGPAPDRAYNAGYHPFAWRGWWDYGTGAIGDMACHTANMLFMALKLTTPVKVAAEAGDVNPETCPSFAHCTLDFPARGSMPAATVHWYEGMRGGKNVLPAPDLVKGQGKRDKGYAIYFDDNKWKFSNPDARDPRKRLITVSSGSFLIGEKATLFSPDDYGAESYIVTPDGVEKLTGDPERLPKNGGGDSGQKKEWVAAIKAGKHTLALSNFDYSSYLTESFLLGNVAIRAGKPFEWDGDAGKVRNCPEAEKFIHTEYRKGWDLLGSHA